MPIRPCAVDLSVLDTLAVDAYAIFVGEDERPLYGLGGLLDWRLAAGVSRHLQEALLLGASGESFLMNVGDELPGKRLFAFGLGPSGGITASAFSACARRAVAALQRAQVTSLAIGLPEHPPVAEAARALSSALHPLESIDVSLFGPLPELALALATASR